MQCLRSTCLLHVTQLLKQQENVFGVAVGNAAELAHVKLAWAYESGGFCFPN